MTGVEMFVHVRTDPRCNVHKRIVPLPRFLERLFKCHPCREGRVL